MARAPTRFSNARYGLYGITLGVFAGIPLGIWLNASSFLWRDLFEPGRPASLTEMGSVPFNLDNLTIPRDEIFRGGPPKDGIPSLTDPPTVHVAEADFMQPDDRIVGIDLNGEQRAYPIRMLNWHEIVNDGVGLPGAGAGGPVPIAVVYCPLCDSVSVLDRLIDDQTLTFGVSGLLYNSNVLMYDREHDALWSQLVFGAVSGPFAGRTLAHLPWEITTFESWSSRFPDSTVVTIETGHQRPSEHTPYAAYFEHDELMFPVSKRDHRLAAKEPVVGVRIGDVTRAYTVSRVASSPDGRLEDRVAGQRIVLEARDERVAVVEIPEGADVIHTFWFAWFSFYPKTELIK